MTLRPYEETDAADKCAAVRESMAELSPWMPWCHAEYSTADAAAWIRKARAGHLDGSLLDFAILDADGTYAGGCGVNRINRLDRCGNVSYWVRTSRSGRGIAREAVRQLLSWTFANTPLNRLEIVVATGNLPSQRVAERVGAHRDAVLKKRLMVRGLPSDAILY
ncbi:MAG: GNAT family N-acetyltransferase, partial [Planctomycetes bacterium]|nr:GNAT family N-acetyltransferase [Planctomycetota bacterium]